MLFTNICFNLYILKLLLDKSRSSVVIVKTVLALRSILWSIGLIYLSKMAVKYDYQNQTCRFWEINTKSLCVFFDEILQYFDKLKLDETVSVQ